MEIGIGKCASGDSPEQSDGASWMANSPTQEGDMNEFEQQDVIDLENAAISYTCYIAGVAAGGAVEALAGGGVGSGPGVVRGPS